MIRNSPSIGGGLAFIACIFALLFAIIPPYLDVRVHDNVGLNFHRVLVAIALVYFICSFVLSSSVRKTCFFVVVRNKPMFFFVLAYLAFRCLSLALNPSLYSAFLFVNEVIMHFFVFIFFSVALGSVNHIRVFLAFSIFGALLVSFFVFFEWVLEGNLFSNLADISTAAGKIAAEVKYRDGAFRSQGTFEHPLALAQYYLLVIPMLLVSFSLKRYRWLSLFLAIIFFSAAHLTMARTFYVAIFLGLIFYLCIMFLWGEGWRMKANARLAFILSMTPLVFFIIACKIYDLAFLGSSAELSSTLTRFGQVYNGLIGVADSPSLGHGIGRATAVIIEIGLHHPDGVVIWNETIDNFYLGLVLDSGIPAFLCFVMVFICSICSGIAVYKDKKEMPFVRYVAISISTSIFCVFISMAVLSIFTVLPFVFALMGLNCALSARSISAGGGLSKPVTN